jgi:hypothetical protein
VANKAEAHEAVKVKATADAAMDELINANKVKATAVANKATAEALKAAKVKAVADAAMDQSNNANKDLDLGCINICCYIGALKYLDLDVGGIILRCYTGVSKYLAITFNYYLGAYLGNFYHEYKTFLYSLVFHAPKPIKLGSKGSSTKLRGDC